MPRVVGTALCWRPLEHESVEIVCTAGELAGPGSHDVSDDRVDEESKHLRNTAQQHLDRFDFRTSRI